MSIVRKEFAINDQLVIVTDRASDNAQHELVAIGIRRDDEFVYESLTNTEALKIVWTLKRLYNITTIQFENPF